MFLVFSLMVNEVCSFNMQVCPEDVVRSENCVYIEIDSTCLNYVMMMADINKFMCTNFRSSHI